MRGRQRTSLPWDAQAAEEKVRSALIYGPTSAAEYVDACNDSCFGTAEAQLVKAAARANSPKDFDRWVTNVRQHKYLQLVGGTRLRGPAREDAARRGRALYCALLCKSYRLASQCYGALMGVVLAAMVRRPGVEMGDAEVWLFAQRHFPQVHFAGLPFDFLERPQLQWVLHTLHGLWAGEVVNPEEYDVVTTLLGLQGDVTRARRKADRDSKDRSRGTRASARDVGTLVDAAARPPRELCKDEEPRPLHSADCPVCGTRLDSLEYRGSSGGGRVLVSLYCRQCRRRDLYSIEDIAEFNRKFGRRS
jgi:hypothetical protein